MLDKIEGTSFYFLVSAPHWLRLALLCFQIFLGVLVLSILGDKNERERKYLYGPLFFFLHWTVAQLLVMPYKFGMMALGIPLVTIVGIYAGFEYLKAIQSGKPLSVGILRVLVAIIMFFFRSNPFRLYQVQLPDAIGCGV